MTKLTGRKVFVNIGSLEIYCFGCNQEVLDEHLRDNKLKHKPIIGLKKFMRDALKSAIQKTFSTQSLRRAACVSVRFARGVWSGLLV